MLCTLGLHLQRLGGNSQCSLQLRKANPVNIAVADACTPALHQAAEQSIPAQPVLAAQGEDSEEEQGQCSSRYLDTLAESLSWLSASSFHKL